MPLPVIAVTNVSTVLTDAEVAGVLPALQRQVTEDFKAYWSQDATLYFLPKQQSLPAGHAQIVVVDNPDIAGALGYHELSSQGTPLGKVFAALDLQTGQKWTVTLSHELLEMLGDPYINYIAIGSDNKLYALEVCDPVEADELGYDIDGVTVSDFVTPSWFEPTEADRVDFRRRISKPQELALGGYISILDPTKGWTQVMAENGNAQRVTINPGSRRSRRAIPFDQRRKSER